MRRTLAVLFLLGPALLAAGPARATHRPLADRDAFAVEADAFARGLRERLGGVPGFSVAVVVDDQVVLVRGWGEADRASGTPVDGETVFYIASATKPFTALAAEILDARGTLDLDTPLAGHVKGLAPELHADRVMLRDLLTHTSGVENGPLGHRLAYTGQHDAKIRRDLLATSVPNAKAPLGTFDYTNVGYNILGVILESEQHGAWQDLLAKEIFVPAGMNHTTALASRPAKEGWTRARPYAGFGPDGLQPLPLEKQDNTMQSAGGMMTTAADLARFLSMQMNEGRLDGRQVVPAEVMRATHRARVETTKESSPLGAQGYAMGWFTSEIAGEPLLHHAGGFPGFAALLSFAPRSRVGVAVLTNEASLGARWSPILALWAYEWWLDVPLAERKAAGAIDALVERMAALQVRIADDLAERSKRVSQLARPITTYEGTYESPLWGTVIVKARDNQLAVTHGNLSCVTTAFTNPETARLELVPSQGAVIAFLPVTGAVERITISEMTFERR